MRSTDTARTAPARQAAPYVALVAALTLAAPVAFAQEEPKLPRPSPHARAEQTVGVTDFAVDYFSPGVKEREIWGGLVPYGELWRTGANDATKLEASHDFRFGGTDVPAGTYALYTIPGKDRWTVILNTNAQTSGTRGYDEKNDVARIEVTPEAIPHRERMIFVFSDTKDDSTRMDLEWEKLRVSVPIEVETQAHAMANIEGALEDSWRPHFAAARWLVENDGDLAQAARYIETSIAIEPTWWNHWVKAQVLAGQGKPQEAVSAAQRAQELGSGDEIFTSFFAADVQKKIDEWQKG